jgi:hypothetical protein
MADEFESALVEELERLSPPEGGRKGDWADVIRRTRPVADPRSSTRLGRLGVSRRLSLGVVLGLLAAGTAIGVLLIAGPSGTSPSLVARAQAALLPGTGQTVLHEKLELAEIGRQSPFRVTIEAWRRSDGQFRAYIQTDPASAEEGEVGASSADKPFLKYYPYSDTVDEEPGYIRLPNPVAIAQADLADGKARPDGTALIDGRMVDRIHIVTTGLDCKPVNSYLLVDPQSYDPVKWTTVVFAPAPVAGIHYDRIAETWRFSIYQYLRPTPANLRLTNIVADHPTAQVIMLPPSTVVPRPPKTPAPPTKC